MKIKLGEIASVIEGQVVGDADHLINGVSQIQDANSGTITFLSNPAYKKYFSHGTSHHLGLDTHDYCDLKMPMEKNMVLTVEPGIYIKEEDFGIRLEDDVVINENGEPTNLMENIPIEIEHIEDLMNSK